MRATTMIDRAAGITETAARRLGDAGGGRGRALARRLARRARRTAAYATGRWRGVRYAAAGRQPDPHVPDDVLADRVRTDLGPVLHRLDLPRVHVTVEHHTVTLHGDAGTLSDVRAIARAVAAVPGVQGVRSALHIGLLPGNSRPSWGRAAPSAVLRSLLDAAGRGGVAADGRAAAVSAVLTALRSTLPQEEWRDLRAHLPADVRSLVGLRHVQPRTAGQDLVSAVAGVTGLSGPVAAQTVRAVTGDLIAVAPHSEAAVRRAVPPDLANPAATTEGR
jgi:uncharacterized protein (DUF2267 family)